MNKAILFNFLIDKENNTVKVERSFNASLNMVWAAWTEAELLDQWWAPKPWKSRTKNMNFEVGGQRLYAMVGPEGEEHWALANFTSISPKSYFNFLDAFCDSEGIINKELPGSDWSVSFTKSNDSTLVNVVIKHKKLSDLEKIIEMGFKEGFTMALENLDNYFQLKK